MSAPAQPLTLRARFPAAVVGLLVLNLAVYALTVADTGSVFDNSDGHLFRATALVPDFVAGGQWWRLVTSGFLHIGPVHLVSNMVALWVVGCDLERVLGHGRFLAIYATSLLGGSAAVMLFSPAHQATAGASGAVIGLMGALLVVLSRLRLELGSALGVVAVNLLLPFLPNSVPGMDGSGGISLSAHVGGLVIGLLVTAGLLYGPAASRPRVGLAATAGVAVVLVVAIAVRAVALGPVTCLGTQVCLPG